MNAVTKKTEKLFSMPWVYPAGKILLIIALSRAQILGTYPFGIAYAALFAEENVFLSLFALAIGATAAGTLFAAKYFLAALFYVVMVYLRKFRERQVKAVTLGIAVISASCVTLKFTGISLAKIIMIAPEAFAVGGLYYLFAAADESGIFSYCKSIVIAGACLGGIYGLSIPYIDADAATLFGMLIVMCISFSCGVPVAALSGAVFGFMIFAEYPQAVELSGIFALSATLAAAISKTGKAGVSAGFLSGITLCVLSMGRLGMLTVSDIFTAPILFLLLPDSVTVGIGAKINRLFQKENFTKESEIVADHIRTVAHAVENLGSEVKNFSKAKKASKSPFDAVSERVCRYCQNREYCTVDTLLLEKILERDGFLTPSNVPKSFNNACRRPEKFLTEFAHIYELNKQTELFRGESVYDKKIVLNQYEEISNLISNLSRFIADIKETDATTERFCVDVYIAEEPRSGQEISGDTVIHFKKGNKYFVILCDGMGSGIDANEISSLTARLFAEFLKSGIDKKSAVNLINSALSLNADRENFSSADILEIDLSKGIAEFLKIGSAQSFLKRKNEITEVTSSALPIGILDNIEVFPQSFNIAENDIILMVSDGISEAMTGVIKNEWINRIFLSDTPCESLASKFLENAKIRSVYSDDMTSVVIKISERS